MNARKFGVLLIAASVLATTGCLDRDLRPLNPCTVSGVVRKVKVSNVDKVDLLFMVDNSNSMAEEQASLSEQFPNLVRTLASGELTVTNAMGETTVETFPPVKSLRVGVVSSDMGTGGFTVPTCLEPGFGDAWHVLGQACRQLGRLDDAIAAHERAVACEPGNALVREEFGATLIRAGENARAVAELETGHTLNPRRSSVLGFLSIAMNEIGDPADATGDVNIDDCGFNGLWAQVDGTLTVTGGTMLFIYFTPGGEVVWDT